MSDPTDSLQALGNASTKVDQHLWINIYGRRTSAVTQTLGLIIFSAEIICTFLRARWDLNLSG
jgi:hypothetical protein